MPTGQAGLRSLNLLESRACIAPAITLLIASEGVGHARCLVLSCPINSVAPVFAVTGMVATDVGYDSSLDPVGEILKPIAAGPSLVHFQRGEHEDGGRQGESKAEERAGAAVAIGESGAGGSASQS